MLLSASAMPRTPAFDITKPVRTRDGRRVLDLAPSEDGIHQFRIEGEPDAVYYKYSINGRAFRDDVSSDQQGTDLVNVTVQTDHVRRSLRPDMPGYRTRDGRPVTILAWDVDDGDGAIVVRIPASEQELLFNPRRKEIIGQFHKSGRVFPSGPDTEVDIVEVTPEITKWVRIYDDKRKPDPDNETKQLVGPAKNKISINGNIPFNWYVFDTEVEAKASLQGVRAVFPITYREGDGV
jgi:hypothetical protein